MWAPEFFLWYLFIIRAAWREYYVVSLCRNLEYVLWYLIHTVVCRPSVL